MSKMKDLAGQRFGELTVLNRIENDRYGRAQWQCRCNCGNLTNVASGNLVSGHTSSCGCMEALNRERMGSRNKRHGKYGTSIYGVWNAIIQRCCNPNQSSFKNYGGRDIQVCDEWKTFDLFYEWAKQSGYVDVAARGECTIERIDVNGDYCPTNCKWVNMQEQANNKRNNHRLLYDGECKTLAQWARSLNIPYDCLKQRINRLGWSAEKALTTPVGEGGVNYNRH